MELPSLSLSFYRRDDVRRTATVTEGRRGCVLRSEGAFSNKGGALRRTQRPSPFTGPLLAPYLVDGAHACDGSDVVGDGDQRGSGQVLLADAVPLLFAHHVAKAVGARQTGSQLAN